MLKRWVELGSLEPSVCCQGCVLQNSSRKVFWSWLCMWAQQLPALLQLRPGCSKAHLWCNRRVAAALTAHQGDSCPGSWSCTSLCICLFTHPRAELACPYFKTSQWCWLEKRTDDMKPWLVPSQTRHRAGAVTPTRPCAKVEMFLCLSDSLSEAGPESGY